MALSEMCVACGSTIAPGDPSHNSMCMPCATKMASKKEVKPMTAGRKMAMENPPPIPTPGIEPWSGWTMISQAFSLNILGGFFVAITIAAIESRAPSFVVFVLGVLSTQLLFFSGILYLAGVIRIAILPLTIELKAQNAMLAKKA